MSKQSKQPSDGFLYSLTYISYNKIVKNCHFLIFGLCYLGIRMFVCSSTFSLVGKLDIVYFFSLKLFLKILINLFSNINQANENFKCTNNLHNNF